MVTIGVLGLQGTVEEHVEQIKYLGLEATIVKKPEQLEEIDGLILPGGVSTTMSKLIEHYGFLEPIRQFAANKKPILGTCAGTVLVAKKVVGSEEKSHLNLMDIVVKRNAFGRQVDSFETNLDIAGINGPFNAVFIRAPYIELAGENVEVLAKYDGKIVAAKEENMIVCAFHPELTGDTRFLALFVKMVEDFKERELQTN